MNIRKRDGRIEDFKSEKITKAIAKAFKSLGENISENNLTKEFIVPMNISLGIVITLFVGLLLIFINKAKSKWFLVAYIILMIIMIGALILLL